MEPFPLTCFTSPLFSSMPRSRSTLVVQPSASATCQGPAREQRRAAVLTVSPSRRRYRRLCPITLKTCPTWSE